MAIQNQEILNMIIKEKEKELERARVEYRKTCKWIASKNESKDMQGYEIANDITSMQSHYEKIVKIESSLAGFKEVLSVIRINTPEEKKPEVCANCGKSLIGGVTTIENVKYCLECGLTGKTI